MIMALELHSHVFLCERERNYTSAGDFNNYFEAVELLAR